MTGPFRAPSSVAFVKEARGSRIVDFDGNEYVDVTMAYGPLILGHSHPVVVEALELAIDRNASSDRPREGGALGRGHGRCDSLRRASGLHELGHRSDHARHQGGAARTGKDKIAKFEGGYHGIHDCAQVSSILATQRGPIDDPESVPEHARHPQGSVDQVLTLSYRQPESFDKIRKHKGELAAVMIEPVPSAFPVEMGDFLLELRRVTRDCGALLILDEVISGFRLSYGGAQDCFGITPTAATYGKIMGGAPAGAIAAPRCPAPLVTSGDALRTCTRRS